MKEAPEKEESLDVTFAIDEIGQLTISATHIVSGELHSLQCDKITNLEQSVLDDLISKVSKINLNEL